MEEVNSSMSPEQVIEQKHAMAGLAEVFHSYYESLRKEGFSRREAMQLLIEYQRDIVRGAQS